MRRGEGSLKPIEAIKEQHADITRATKFDLVINLNTARALGIAVPQAVLLRADRVIQ